MEITKKDFEILHWIEYMNYNNPKLLSKQLGSSKKEAENKLLELEKKDLIKTEIREKKIYGSQLTKKGKGIWNSKKYSKWKEELDY
jgi:DNA-binding MarR family transcriptional regulator